MKIEEYVNFDSFDVIIIDDLERSHLSIDVALGFLNDFVEHEKQKVIIIASEEELERRDPNYARKLEKVFGFTLRVRPETRLALNKLMACSGKALASYIEKFSDDIQNLFNATGSDNLRAMLQSVAEAEPLLVQMAEYEDIGDRYVREVFNLFTLLNVLYKIGMIKRADLEQRKQDWFSVAFEQEREGSKKTTLARLQENYQNIDLHSFSLPNNYLVSKICDGLHRPELLERNIRDELAKGQPRLNEEWRNVWYYLRRNEEVTHKELLRMIVKINRREYKDPREILHVFGLVLEMLKIGALSIDRTALWECAREYVSAIGDSKCFSPHAHRFDRDSRHTGAYGLGFTRENDPMFRRLWLLLADATNQAHLNELYEAVRHAARSLAVDTQRFIETIGRAEESDEMYSTPLLHKLDAREFADGWLAADAEAQFHLASALAQRYKSSHYPEVQRRERRWLKSLSRDVRRKLVGASPLRVARMERLLKWAVDPYLT